MYRRISLIFSMCCFVTTGDQPISALGPIIRIGSADVLNIVNVHIAEPGGLGVTS